MISHYSQLSEVNQAFVDAVSRNNGRMLDREKQPPRPRSSTISSDHVDTTGIGILLEQLDPDMGYDDWLRVAMAIFYATGGSDDGFTLFDSWSAQGTKYSSIAETEKKWRSFDPDYERPVTIGTLIWMIENGVGVVL